MATEPTTTEGECGNWKAIKAGEELLVYGMCTFRSGEWQVSLEYGNQGTPPDPATLRLITERTGGGMQHVMSYLLPARVFKGSSEATGVSVDGDPVELEDWTPRT
jgi:hypothetical protein